MDDDRDRGWLIRHKYNGKASAEALTADLARLAAGEPLDYVIGWSDFLGQRIDLSERPLIPRTETESWTVQAIGRIKERQAADPTRQDQLSAGNIHCLDLCAGSGCIGIAVLQHSAAQVDFIEQEKKFIRQIEKNIALNMIAPHRARIIESDLFAALHDTPSAAENYDFILTNPPYLPAGRSLPSAVAAWEPSGALLSGSDGLDAIRRIITHAPVHLRPGGELWLEYDTDQAEEVERLAVSAGFSHIKLHPDQFGRSRFLVAS